MFQAWYVQQGPGDRWLSVEAGVGTGQVPGHYQSEGHTGDSPLLPGFTSGPFFLEEKKTQKIENHIKTRSEIF